MYKCEPVGAHANTRQLTVESGGVHEAREHDVVRDASAKVPKIERDFCRSHSREPTRAEQVRTLRLHSAE